MSKDKDYQLFVRSNEYVAAVSLLYLNGNNIEDSDKQEIITNT